MKSKTEILNIAGTWEEVVDDCRASVSKPTLGHAPSDNFKRDILIAEHTPIRLIRIRWRWKSIPSWVATHMVRNIFYKVISTQRSDRTAVPRDKLPQDSPVTYTGAANPQHLIDTSRKRLCYTASQETRQQWEDLKRTIKDHEPQISSVMVPNCVYRCGCPEIGGGCGWFDRIVKKYPSIASTNIKERYDVYNEIFYGGNRNEVSE